MPTLVFESPIAAPLDAVWSFYDDPVNGIPALTPPDLEVRLEHADLPVRQSARITVSLKGPFGRRLRWTLRITAHHPPHGVVFGAEARFTDQQESGPFALWKHEHEFEAIDSKTTRLVDRITYRLPLGPFGWLLDLVYFRRRLRSHFRYRHDMTRRSLTPPPAP